MIDCLVVLYRLALVRTDRGLILRPLRGSQRRFTCVSTKLSSCRLIVRLWGCEDAGKNLFTVNTIVGGIRGHSDSGEPIIVPSVAAHILSILSFVSFQYRKCDKISS